MDGSKIQPVHYWNSMKEGLILRKLFYFILGEIQRKGMVIPLQQDIYDPILLRLKHEGILARETIESI